MNKILAIRGCDGKRESAGVIGYSVHRLPMVANRKLASLARYAGYHITVLTMLYMGDDMKT